MLLRTCWRVGSDDAVIQIHHKYIWTIEFKVRSAKKGTPRHFVAVFREERRESRFKGAEEGLGEKRGWTLLVVAVVRSRPLERESRADDFISPSIKIKRKQQKSDGNTLLVCSSGIISGPDGINTLWNHDGQL